MARKSYDPLIRALAAATNLDFHFVEKQLTEMIKDLAPVLDIKQLKKEIKIMGDELDHLYEKLDSKEGLV